MNRRRRTKNESCAVRLRVLADATRLEVLRSLITGPRHVGQLNESIPIDQSLLSHHLRVLRDARLVEARRDGKAVLYRLAPGILREGRDGPSIDLGCCQLAFEKDARA
jgi:DNA-binding transcriptional ArsR family regulator